MEENARRTFATRGHEATVRGQPDAGGCTTRRGRVEAPVGGICSSSVKVAARQQVYQKHAEAMERDVQDEIQYIDAHFPAWKMIIDTRSLDPHEYYTLR